MVYNEFWKEGILCNIQTLWDPKGGFYINGKRKMVIFPKRLAKKIWLLVQMLRFLPKLNGKVVWFLLSALWPSPYCRTPWFRTFWKCQFGMFQNLNVVGIEHHFIFDNSRVNCNRIPFCNSTSLLPTITRKRTLHTCGVYI